MLFLKLYLLLKKIICNFDEKYSNMGKMKYPNSKQGNVVDTYFGKEIPDPYRWLENDLSDETKIWVKEQNATSQNYLNTLPIRNTIFEKLKTIWNYPKQSIPFQKGDYLYYFKNNGLQNQNILFRQSKNSEEELVLDPNTFSEEGTDALGMFKFSENNKYLAYFISENGSDWGRIVVMDLNSKTTIEENVFNVKFSDIGWLGEDGFYYSTYALENGSKLSAKTDRHLLFYHKLFTAQETDLVVFGDKDKYRYIRAGISEDERFLILYASNTAVGNKIFYKDLKNETEIKAIVNNEEANTYVYDTQGDELILSTNKNAPNSKIIKININNTREENWKDLIDEDLNVEEISTAGGYIFVNYSKDVRSCVKQYDYDGNFIREIKMPEYGTINGFNGKKTDVDVYFQFTNNTTPNSIYKFNVKNGEKELFWSAKVDIELDQLESKQVFYSSKDGTKIPMTISYKKGVKLDGSAPTILYGYGGFHLSLMPFFSVINSVWIEMGGVYAVANIRGGGEYGKTWHEAGTKLKKQNVFDDFIAAAEYLIENKYTSAKHLAIRGGSNGGLLVGAVMLQRPELFKVALPAVGVLDMLRYHKFTSGAGWSYDYGTSEDNEEMFNFLLNYSPLHNVKKAVKYPHTLITTGDHDDRVVPAHSFKFAAKLQNTASDESMYLIRIETNAGHGAGMSVEKMINSHSDILGFAWYHTNK